MDFEIIELDEISSQRSTSPFNEKLAREIKLYHKNKLLFQELDSLLALPMIEVFEEVKLHAPTDSNNKELLEPLSVEETPPDKKLDEVEPEEESEEEDEEESEEEDEEEEVSSSDEQKEISTSEVPGETNDKKIRTFIIEFRMILLQSSLFLVQYVIPVTLYSLILLNFL